MAEVGVLDLVVHAGDIQKQAQALANLGAALTIVKDAVTDGINLSPVSEQIKKLTNNINQSVNKTVLNKIKKLGETLKQFGQSTSGLPDGGNLAALASAITKVQNAAANGNSLGKLPGQLEKLKTAMGGNWGTTTKFDRMTQLKDTVNAFERNHTADKLRNVASALREYGNAIEKAGAVVESGSGGKRTKVAPDLLHPSGRVNVDDYKESNKIPVKTLQEVWDTYNHGIEPSASASKRPFTYHNVKVSSVLTFDGKETRQEVSSALDEVEKQIEESAERIKENNAVGKAIEHVSEEFEQLKSSVLESLPESVNEFQEATEETNETLQHTEEIVQQTENAVQHLIKALDPASQRLKDMRDELYLYEKGDFYQPRPNNTNVHVQPTDLYSNSPQAMALLGQWGENQRIAAFHDEMRGTGETLEELTERIYKATSIISTATEPINDFNNELERMGEIIQFVGMSWQATGIFENMFKMWNQHRMGMALEGRGSGFGGYLPPSYIQGEGSVRDYIPEQRWPNDDIGNNMPTNELDNLRERMEESRGSSRDLNRELKDLDKELKQKKTDVGALERAFRTFRDVISRLGIAKLTTQFLRMARMRMMRYAIREIAKGFSEGVENVYRFSKAIDSSFYKNMDNAASALLQMKNSVGAAAAPLIQMLIPYLQQLVNGFIQVVNWANQFFALMNGQTTWTHAVPATASAFEDQANAAHHAANAVKDLLADWDELNIIQSQTGGGTNGNGVSNAEDYLNMFEEVATFDNRIKRIFDFIKTNLDTFKTMATGIGAAILGWRISSAFADVLPWLSQLGSGLGALGTIAITFALVDASGKAYMQSGDIGWFLLDAIGGAVGAEIAGEIVSHLLGNAAGEIVRGFTLIIEGLINVRNAVEGYDAENEARSWMLGVLGDIEIGVGAALLALAADATVAGALVAGGVVTLAALAITIPILLEAKRKASYRKMAVDAFEKAGRGGISPQQYLTQLQLRLNQLTAGTSLVVDAAMGLDEHGDKFKESVESLKALNVVVAGNEALTQEDAENFKKAWEIVIEELNEISHIAYDTIFTGLDQAIASGNKAIQEAAVELRKQTVWASGIMNGAIGAMETDIKFLENKILTGSATEEEIAQYKNLYTILAKETESGLEDLKKALEEGAVFDFSGGEESALTAAVEFVNSMDGMIKPALEAVQAEYDAEMKAIQESKDMLEKMHEAGYIKDDVYDDMKKYYADMEVFFAGWLEERQKEINSSTQDAFDAIFREAITGYLDLDQTDEEALLTYVNDIFNPLVEAIVAAGGEVPKEVRDIMMRSQTSAYLSEAFANVMPDWSKFASFDGKDADEIAGTMTEWLVRVIDDTNHDLPALLDKNGLNPFVYLTDDLRKSLENYIISSMDPDIARDVLNRILPEYSGEIEALITSYEFRAMRQGQAEAQANAEANRIKAAEEQAKAEAEAAMEAAQAALEEVKAQRGDELGDVISGALWDSELFAASDLRKLAEDYGLTIQQVLDYVTPDMPNEVLENLKELVEVLNLIDGADYHLPNLGEELKESIGDDDTELHIDELIEDAAKIKEVAQDTTENSPLKDSIKVARLDVDAYCQSLREMEIFTDGAIQRIWRMLSGLPFTFGAGASGSGRPDDHIFAQPIAVRGTPVTSGDLVLQGANLNVMSKGGGRQDGGVNVMSGLSQGMSDANEDVVSELRVLSGMMQKMLATGLTAKVVPSSSMGRNNAKSAEAYERVRG